MIKISLFSQKYILFKAKATIKRAQMNRRNLASIKYHSLTDSDFGFCKRKRVNQKTHKDKLQNI